MTANNSTKAQSSSLDFRDICYVLFRHKWKILLSSVAGLGGAALLFFLQPAVYLSEAKLYVRYVLDRGELRPYNSTASDPQPKSPDPRGDGIINTEKEILDSFDLASQVASLIGPEKLLGKAKADNAQVMAASLIKRNLAVETTKNSSIISVVFHHSDPAIVQPVVGLLITNYLAKHMAVHRPASALDDLRSQTDQRRSELSKTEVELNKSMTEAGITSLDEAKKYAEQMLKIKEKLNEAEVDLVGRQAVLGELQTLSSAKTNQIATAVKTEPEVSPEIPLEKAEDYKTEYKNIAGHLESLHKKENEYLGSYTAESFFVVSVRKEIAKYDNRKRELEKSYPQLTRISAAGTTGSGQTIPGVDPSVAAAQDKAALEAKIAMLRNQLNEITEKVEKVRGLEPRIVELQRQKDLQEKSYRYLQASLEQWNTDESVGAGKFSNINVVQEPSPPFKDISKTLKSALIIAVLGMLGGIGLAFFIELIFDHSIRRAKDVTDRLHLPLFLTIPYLNGHRRGRSAQAANLSGAATAEGRATAATPSGSTEGSPPEAAPAAVANVDDHSQLGVYYEALRDRLINYFDLNNMTHKPKLIAIANCSKGSGSTSTAAGLAASLSETGEGNVLLVDMNAKQGAAHPFYKGKPACGLLDVLETEKRTPAQFQGNLYLASVNHAADQLPSALPKRFMHLLPKLKMSDYDYIIFDMPAISQTSITSKVASLMDMVLLVVESEKTNQHTVEQASSLLAESNATMKVVLNKYRRHVPQWLQQEL